MDKHVVSILVENNAGVLSRVSGLFSRRGYNIDSLSVGETEDPQYSRITVVTRGDDWVVEQICNQLKKLVVVERVMVLSPKTSVFRELALVRVRAEAQKRSEVVSIVEIFRAGIIDVSNDALTIEVTGTQGKIKALVNLLEPYGILEIVRTGLTAIQRGDLWTENEDDAIDE